MTTQSLSRRAFGIRLFACSAAGLAVPPAARRLLASTTAVRAPAELVHDAEMIHDVLTVDAAPARVFDVLVDAEHFTAMTRFSTVPAAPPARIAREPGGEFWLFGGHILGRQIELVRGKRIVQAWRVADWEPGVYSIARFELAPDGKGTRLTFDHTGFPKGLGAHLEQGWSANYWNPIRRYLR